MLILRDIRATFGAPSSSGAALNSAGSELSLPQKVRGKTLPSSGWWLSPTPRKNMKVSWDDEIPN